MKWLAILMLCLAGLASAAQKERDPAKLSTLEFYGRSYYLLSQWAESKQFRMRTYTRYFGTNKTEEVWLSNKVASLVFRINSRRADINGIAAWLSYPVIIQNGAPVLAKLDVESLLHPVLYPAKSKPSAQKKIIVLDPGHGGKDPGNHVNGQLEKTYTLLLAKRLQKKLQSAGFRVYLTRSDDSFMDLEERVKFAQRKRAHLFLSLHFNSMPGNGIGVRGAEVYCLTPAGANSTNGSDPKDSGALPGNRQNNSSALLAYQVQKSLVRNLKLEDRGLRRGRWAVLRTAEIPAILIEGGFMSDPAEAKSISSSSFQQNLAQAITDGLVAYLKAVTY